MVIGLAAVFEQDSVDFPDYRKQVEAVFGVVKTFLKHFVETDGVDEEATVNAVHFIVGNASVLERKGEIGGELTVRERRSIWYLVIGFLCSGLRMTPGMSKCSAS